MALWSAYQHFEESSKGSIEVGKLADLVILSNDPTAVAQDAIDQLKVTETIKEGQTIFKLTPESQRKGDLMLKPDSAGRYALTEFLRQVAVDFEFRKLPAKQQTPFARALLAAARTTRVASCLPSQPFAFRLDLITAALMLRSCRHRDLGPGS